jgi:MOSC domain-containing protein YiiM
MDLIASGLKDAMEDGEQGALAKVLQSGTISVGDRVSIDTADWQQEKAG